MITLNKVPPEVVLTGNPVKYTIASDNAIQTPPVYARLKILIDDIEGSEDGTLTFTFGDQEIEFVLKEDPDDSGTQLPTADQQDTAITWGAKLFAGLKKNYQLYSNYYFTFDEGQSDYLIIIIAKQPGTDYSLDFDIVDVDGVSEFENIDGVDPVFRDNFGIVCLVMDSNAEKIAEEHNPSNAGGVFINTVYADFDIAEYLNSRLSMVEDPRFSITMDPQVGPLVNLTTKFLLPFNSFFAEKYSGIVRQLYADETRYAMMGGFSRDFLINEDDYFDDSDNLKKFLTWQPNNKLTTLDTKERLYFLFKKERDPSDILMVVKVYFTDNTTEEVSFPAVEISVSGTYSVFECIIGGSELDLTNVDPQKTVEAWEVWILELEDIIRSEKRKFIIDLNYYQETHTFLFRNSFSAYDILRFTGKYESNLEHEISTSEITSEDVATYFNPPLKVFEKKESRLFKVNTGWIDSTMKNVLRDFLASTEVYELIDDQVLPIVITSTKHPLYKSGVNYHSLNIEYRRAYTDKFFSNQ